MYFIDHVHVYVECGFLLQTSEKLKKLLTKENITLLSALTFDDELTQVIRQIKVTECSDIPSC